MPKIKSSLPKMFIEVDYHDGYQDSVQDDALIAFHRFKNIVNSIIDSHSDIKEVRLLDNAHRVYKRYSQLF